MKSLLLKMRNKILPPTDLTPLLKALNKTQRDMESRFNNLTKEVRSLERNNYQQITGYMELRRDFTEPALMPPLRGYAISPDLIFYLSDLLAHYRPMSILEFGSGFSSVVFSRYAHKNSAHVTSVDHETEYAKKSAELVRIWGYEASFSIVTANVIEQTHKLKTQLFYDANAIPSDAMFDFVFLDGPPQKLGLEVRGGLLPLLVKRLKPGCIIVLDDYYRPGEQAIIKRWVADGLVDIVEENRSLEKHAAVVQLRIPL